MSGAGNGQEAPAQHLYLERARSLFSCGEFEAALGELATLLAIDPENDDARSLEQEIWLLQNKQTTDERLGRLRVHLRAAENLANQKMFSRALDELAKAFVIDPLNEDVLKLETTIRERETEAVRAEMNLKIR